MTLRIGTRGSALARTQSGAILRSLGDAGITATLEVIRTAGDRFQTAPFGSIGPQGVFVREIEQALVERRIELAVHSFKDLPTSSPAELTIAAVPAREDPADVLVLRAPTHTGEDWLPLPPGASVGTASARRRAWLTHFRPDLRVLPLRGNVPTRLGRLVDGKYDAILLAAAGLARLSAGSAELEPLLRGLVCVRLDPARFVPAPAQGALALQCRRDDAAVGGLLAGLDDPSSRAAVEVERAALARAEGGCDTAFGAWCEWVEGAWRLTAMLERDARVLHASVSDPDPSGLAERVFAALTAADPVSGER